MVQWFLQTIDTPLPNGPTRSSPLVHYATDTTTGAHLNAAVQYIKRLLQELPFKKCGYHKSICQEILDCKTHPAKPLPFTLD